MSGDRLDARSSQEQWLGRLLEVGRSLVTELDLAVVLDRVLETAREITGARYAALGVLNEERTGLARFITSGIDEQAHRMIGDLPTGRGVLGVLIEQPRPLRLEDVGRHPSSYGFPSGHPVMRSFLGVPVLVRGEVWGNLYLTEKQEGDFTERDEQAAVILADWAAVAINNARLYETSERRRGELERAVRGLRATSDVAEAIGGEIELERVLELIAKRGRALVDARSLVIMLEEGEELVVQASAGHVEEAAGTRLPLADSTSGQVLRRGRAERIEDVGARLGISPEEFGVLGAHTALIVPMVYRGEPVGVLAAFDHGPEADDFSEEHEVMLRTFAASAATAVALAQSVMADRMRSSLAAADEERRRWARELHDETLQSLGGLRLLLSAALRRDDQQLRPPGDARRGRAPRARDRQPARDHHGPPPGRARRAGAARRDRSAARPSARTDGPDDRLAAGALDLGCARGTAGGVRRDRRLPARAGGAHERGQARRCRQGRGRGPREPGRAHGDRLRRRPGLRPGGRAAGLRALGDA